MRVAIHQPQYISWVGYYNKILRSDLFVYYDDCQYQDDGFQNRNKIFYSNKYRWLTIPISGNKHMKILETKPDNKSAWQKKHKEIISSSYLKSKYFNQIGRQFFEYYDKPYSNITDFVIDLDEAICKILEIKTRKIRSSELKLPEELKSTDRLVAICKAIGADTYLSGARGRNYLQEDKFKRENIKLIFQKPIVPQKIGNSILDLLFIYGPKKTRALVAGVFKE